GVGVAGDRHAGHLSPAAARALGVPGGTHTGDLPLQPGDAGLDAAPVGLQLGLTGAAQPHAAGGAAGPAAGLPGERLAPAAQPGQEVTELRQFDLCLALPAARVLGEDVQDQGGAVDDLDPGLLLQVAQLARGQLAVADHRVRAGGGDHVAQFVELAAADVGGRV